MSLSHRRHSNLVGYVWRHTVSHAVLIRCHDTAPCGIVLRHHHTQYEARDWQGATIGWFRSSGPARREVEQLAEQNPPPKQ